MKIDSTEFGSITIDGTTYSHDILIQLSGEVVKRKKKLSKKYYGTSHIISLEEAEFVYEKGCDTLVLGTGQYGNVRLSPEAAGFFEHHGCQVILMPTPDAIETFNKTRGKARAIGLFHVTC
ncbi:MAG: MTH938/NDUFAF3 family protein [Thiobacillus sp.]